MRFIKSLAISSLFLSTVAFGQQDCMDLTKLSNEEFGALIKNSKSLQDGIDIVLTLKCTGWAAGCVGAAVGAGIACAGGGPAACVAAIGAAGAAMPEPCGNWYNNCRNTIFDYCPAK